MLRFLRLASAVLLLAAAAGCNPNQRQDAEEKGNQVAEKGRQVFSDLSQRVKNASLTSKVKTALSLRAGLDTSGINVDADEKTGQVKLGGRVPSAQQSRLAEEVASGTVDVKGVVNDLAVPPAGH